MCFLKGAFLVSKTSGKAYNSSFKVLNPIEILSSGNYLFKFSTYINCPNSECETAKDFINIIIKDGDNYKVIYQNGSEFGRFQDNQWIESVIQIFIEKPSLIYVCIYLK